MRRLIIFSILILSIFFSCDYCPTQARGSTFEWQTSAPSEHGLNTAQLSAALDEASRRPSIYSVLVIRDGYIVAERYYRGYDENSSFNIRSVSKSFLSALVGIAIDNGVISSINNKMLDYFPEFAHPGLDARKNSITIKHLLTMQGGIEHEHNNYSRLYNTQNWIQSAIEEPLQYNPGERHSYNTFHTHLLSAILSKESGLSTWDYGEEFLFNTLGVTIQDWEQDRQGIYFGGNSMYFTTRDMAKLGYLYLNGGEINGIQIVPYDWVRTSLENTMPDFQKGWTWRDMTNGGYGYLWWLGRLGGHKVFMAIGHGGQFVANFPELDMIIVTNSNAYVGWDTANNNEELVIDLMANYILPAVE